MIADVASRSADEAMPVMELSPHLIQHLNGGTSVAFAFPYPASREISDSLMIRKCKKVAVSCWGIWQLKATSSARSWWRKEQCQRLSTPWHRQFRTFAVLCGFGKSCLTERIRQVLATVAAAAWVFLLLIGGENRDTVMEQAMSCGLLDKLIRMLGKEVVYV